jgi:hypothetical protein
MKELGTETEMQEAVFRDKSPLLPFLGVLGDVRGVEMRECERMTEGAAEHSCSQIETKIEGR